MSDLKYIYDCDLGITRFDKYFAYLKSIEKHMPPVLASFALDRERYILNSDATLHDAWLSQFRLVNRFSEGKIVESLATVELLHSSHDFVLQLEYSDVVKTDFSMGLQVPSRRPVDLLVHEFTMHEPGVFQHLLHFEKEQWIALSFKRFSFATNPN